MSFEYRKEALFIETAALYLEKFDVINKIKEVNNLLEVYDKKTLFSYDTTFNIGDFYMTP